MTIPLLLETLSGRNTSETPIWLMRQAGRYLAEYREMRKNQEDFISFCLDSEKACEVTLQPINRFNFDAAIIFSDILLVPWALGRNVRFISGSGPKMDPLTPNTHLKDASLDKIESLLAPVGKTVKLTRSKLAREKALIAFSGAPWTVITYMIEGGSSRDFNGAKQWLWSYPKEFAGLLDYVTQATSRFLALQAKMGADVLMLFDSWASIVPAEKREEIIIKPIYKIINDLRQQGFEQPIIGFPKGIGEGVIAYTNETGIDALAIDHTTDPRWIDSVLPKNMPVQGNLDPLSLLGSKPEMLKSVDYILESFKNRPHIFNLGHGITPATPIASLENMVKRVKAINNGI